MLQDEIREARVRSGLSQVKLAELAGVPRTQLRKLENGQNVTLETLMKILAALPDLQRVTVSGIELQLEQVDLDALYDGLAQIISAAARVMSVIERARPNTALNASERRTAAARQRVTSGESPRRRERVWEMEERFEPPEPPRKPEPPPSGIQPGGAGATLYESPISDERLEELQKIDDRMRREEEEEERALRARRRGRGRREHDT